MATGVLPIFIGRATRIAEFCENAEKEYIAGIRLGLVTDTQDTTGSVIVINAPSPIPDISGGRHTTVAPEELAAVIPRFLGAQKQLPPMYSAIKIGGKKLYELARRGEDVPREQRDIFISKIEILGGSGRDYTLRVACSKGTYIRTLCHDIGADLGCGGAMSSLRRTRAGTFTLEQARTLDEILDSISNDSIENMLIPVDSVFSEYPAITLNAAQTLKCKNGIPPPAPHLPDGKYRFYGPDKEFLILGEIISGETKIAKTFFLPPQTNKI